MIDKSKIKIQNAAPKKGNTPHLVYKIKVTLNRAPYPIWRVVLVDGEQSLTYLMRLLLEAMGWDRSHLYCLDINGIIFDGKIPYDGICEGENGKDYKICQVFGVGSKCTLIYDYGDNWRHTVTVMAIFEDDTSVVPFCVKGKGACPPDDCGGCYGFAHLLEVISDPDDPEYKSIQDWLGVDFDPGALDLSSINRLLLFAETEDIF